MTDIVLSFPLFCIILSLLCAAVSSVLKGRQARTVTMCLTGAVAAMNCVLLVHNLGLTEPVTFAMGHFPAPWGNEISFGIIEPLLSAVFSSVIFLSILGGSEELKEDIDGDRLNLYFLMLDLVQVAMLALIYTNDLFTGYVFIEICTLSSCGILIIRQAGRTTLAAVRYMIFNLVGSGLFLLSVILLYQITGHLLMPDLKEAVVRIWSTGEYRVPLLASVCLMTMGLSIKSGLFPFHFWMPDTYGYSTPTSASVLSGVISKGYICLFIRIIFKVIGTDVFYASGAHNIVFVLGLAGMIVGSLSAIKENDICRMTALSSAAQIGYIFMGIGLSPGLGIAAAVFHIIFHAVTKPLLFISAARLRAVSGGSRRFKDLQGAGHRAPLAGIGFTVGAFSMVGVPLFAGFVAKYLFADAAFRTLPRGIPVLLVLAVSTVLNIFYFLRTVIRIYTKPEAEYGEARSSSGGLTRFTVSDVCYTVSTVCYLAVNFILGINPQPVINLIEKGLALLG